MEPAPWNTVRWVREKGKGIAEAEPPMVILPSGCSLATDQQGQWVVLLSDVYMERFLTERNEDLEILDRPFS